MRNKFIILFCICILFSSCQNKAEEKSSAVNLSYSSRDINKEEILKYENNSVVPIVEMEIVETENIETENIETENIAQKYNIIFENSNYKYSKYESNKPYLGVDISQDTFAGESISQFNNLTEINNSIFITEIKLGEEYPINFVLECIENKKTPFITVIPENNYNYYNLQNIEKLSKEAGSLNIPVFINLFPVKADFKFQAKQYKEFIQNASIEFKNNSPNVALVWQSETSSLQNYENFYAGNDFIDWVCTEFTENQKGDFNIDSFYNYFHKMKPIILKDVKVSYFSTDDMKYKTEASIEKLQNIYNKILENYPRIKMITYKSYNETNKIKHNISDKQSYEQIYNNYQITEDKKLSKAYKEISQREVFSSELVLKQQTSDELFKSNYFAYKINNVFYIEIDMLENDLNIIGFNQTKGYLYNSKNLIPVAEIKKHTTFSVSIDEKNKNVYLFPQSKELVEKL